jgi:Mn2+/Fe2+ NRAMP family transporter
MDADPHDHRTDCGPGNGGTHGLGYRQRASDLIREEFGLRATFITMAILAVADFGNIAAEFAGIASGMGVFGVSKYLAVPVGAALVWVVIVKGRYKPVERMMILFSLIYFTYPVSAYLANPTGNLRCTIR